jgi:hypothetical protein
MREAGGKSESGCASEMARPFYAAFPSPINGASGKGYRGA